MQTCIHFPQQLSHCDLRNCLKFLKYNDLDDVNVITNQLFQIPQ
jgi:hypothetical protein